MRCISLWQPHATLFAIGARQIETRGEWFLGIKYRGPLLIHAAQKWDRARRADYEAAGKLLQKYHFQQSHALTAEQAKVYAMKGSETLGRIIAIGELCDIKPIPDVPTEGFDRFFGSFGPGRCGLFLRNLRPVLPLIPFTGRQGFFDVPDELVKEYL